MRNLGWDYGKTTVYGACVIKTRLFPPSLSYAVV